MKTNHLFKIACIFTICLGMTSCLELPMTDSGNIGTIHWTYDYETHVLAFSGTGETPPGSRTYEEEYDRYKNMIDQVIISDGITGIGEQAFANYHIKSITIPPSVINIRSGAFMWCDELQSIAIPNTVKMLGNNAFCDCEGLMFVTIGDGVAEIGYDAFKQCYNLVSVVIGKNVSLIGDYAFSNCNTLNSVICYAVTPPKFDTFPAFEAPGTIDLFVPAQSVNAYKNDEKWKNFKSISAIQ